MMQTLYNLKDIKESFKFEREHPKELRWDDKYKMYMLTQHGKCQGVWLRDKTHGLVAEMIVSWESDNILHADGITVLPEFRRKGLATQLIEETLNWAENMGFEYLVGEARKGSSWNVFENLGASPLFEHKNWNGTGETYMFFKMNI
jgi:GNAT superfamily N-acetyltransferase